MCCISSNHQHGLNLADLLEYEQVRNLPLDINNTFKKYSLFLLTIAITSNVFAESSVPQVCVINTKVNFTAGKGRLSGKFKDGANFSSNFGYCLGTLVGQSSVSGGASKVLTAAHCTPQHSISRLKSKVDGTRLPNDPFTGREIKFSQVNSWEVEVNCSDDGVSLTSGVNLNHISLHPSYKSSLDWEEGFASGNASYENKPEDPIDIAVITLNSPIDIRPLEVTILPPTEIANLYPNCSVAALPPANNELHRVYYLNGLVFTFEPLKESYLIEVGLAPGSSGGSLFCHEDSSEVMHVVGVNSHNFSFLQAHSFIQGFSEKTLSWLNVQISQ